MKIIRSESEYKKALIKLEKLFNAKPNSSKGDELELLSLLIEKYEQEKFPIDMPDPIDAIKFRMEQMGYTQNDLAKIIGLKSRASEILNRKRPLTLEMIRNLHEKMNIPTQVLIQAY
ncbi:MAG: helix-turn-helix domain-containing protein [Bacteroidota bacterium]